MNSGLHDGSVFVFSSKKRPLPSKIGLEPLLYELGPYRTEITLSRAN